MKDTIKQPAVMAATGITALLIIGTALGWFTIGNELAASLVEDELAAKELAAYTTGLISIVATILAAITKKKGLLVVSILVSAYASIMVFNQLPDEASKEIVGLTVNIGYWITLLGGVGSVIANGLLMKKGFDSSTPSDD